MNFIPSDNRHPFKYYWDENATGITANGKQYKGIVIAILKKNSWEAINEAEAKGVVIPGVYKDYFMNSTFKGISYCSVDDEFDLKRGMRIAKLRALKKYYNNKWNVLNAMGEAIMKDFNKVEDMRGNAAHGFLETCYRLGKLKGGE